MAAQDTTKRKRGPYLSYLTNPLHHEVPRSTRKLEKRGTLEKRGMRAVVRPAKTGRVIMIFTVIMLAVATLAQRTLLRAEKMKCSL